MSHQFIAGNLWILITRDLVLTSRHEHRFSTRRLLSWLRNRLSRLLLGVLLVTFFDGFSHAETANEAAVKVAFVYNFFKFIEWPAAAAQQSSVNLCLSNNLGLGDALAALEGKTLNGKPLTVLRNMTGKDLKNCHMVYIDAEESTVDMIARVKGLPIVTVSDEIGFIEQGGMIGLVHDETRLSFEINLDSAKVSDVHISANLLKLAKKVLFPK